MADLGVRRSDGKRLGAIVDLPGPASNPGVTPPMPAAAVFYAILAVVVPTLFIAFGPALYGVRGDGNATP